MDGSIPLASGSADVGGQDFDLRSESASERGSQFRENGPYAVVVFVFGSLFLVASVATWIGHVASPLDSLILAFIGAGFFSLGVLLYWLISTVGDVVRMRVDEAGLHFTRSKGRIDSWDWQDPQLMVDLFHINSPELLPSGDARISRPDWIEVTSTSGLSRGSVVAEIGLPPEAAAAIFATASRSGAGVDFSYGFFHWTGGKYPALVFSDDSAPVRGPRTSGSRAQIRGQLPQ